MFPKTNLLTIFLASSGDFVAALKLPQRSFCHSPSPSAEYMAMAHQHIVASKSSFAANETIDVDTYIHVVAPSKSVEDGYLSRAKIDEQMRVLHREYAETPFKFTVKDVDWTVNTEWKASPPLGDKEGNMREILRKGDYRSLNIYVMKDVGGGYCNFPKKVEKDSADFIADGCVIGSEVVPGGSHAVFNEGQILVHEVGHWNGLFHTFNNGCRSPGDYVDDTPYEREPYHMGSCPKDKDIDSCPDQPGLDSIHNHMGYYGDACKAEFTTGQVQRMISSWNAFRRNWE